MHVMHVMYTLIVRYLAKIPKINRGLYANILIGSGWRLINTLLVLRNKYVTARRQFVECVFPAIFVTRLAVG